ncbi:MAG: hypothetical protein ABIJ34_08875 [archaeon]
MNIFIHLMANLIVSYFLKIFLNMSDHLLLVFILAGVLIDIDHLFLFAVKYRKIDPKEWLARAKMLRKNMESELYIFHSPEFNLLLIAAAFFYEQIWLIILSNFIHISLDIIEHFTYHRNFRWIRRWSILFFLSNRLSVHTI